MSVIIRLQNLPWSANAMDIRNFFRGLSIPEGGVHIVGGEQGDAFIAFSTDEDARQAMLNDGGKIREIQVKLLLSSRSEMHKVIETARQSVSFLQLAPPVLPVPQQPSLPPSISGLLAQNIKLPPNLPNLPAFPISHVEAPVITVGSLPVDLDKDKDMKRNYDKNNERKSTRSRSRSRDRDKKDRGRDKKRDDKRERSRSRDRDRRRRDRSRSRDRRDRRDTRDDRKRDRKDRSRERERVNDSRIPRKDDKALDLPNEEQNKIQMPMQINKNFGMKSKEGLLGDFPHSNILMEHPNKNMNPIVHSTGVRPHFQPRVNQNSNWSDNTAANAHMMPMANIQQNIRPNMMSNVRTSRFSDNHNSLDQLHRLQELDERRNPNAFQISEVNNPAIFSSRNMGPRFPYQNANFDSNNTRVNFHNSGEKTVPVQHDNRGRYGNNTDVGLCVKIQNLLSSIGYGDLRRFFAGNFISNQGLKIINNDSGKRSGTAYIKFFKMEGKQNALRKSGELLRGRPVTISHLGDEEFENAVDSYRPNRESEESGDELDMQKNLMIHENDNDDELDNFKVLLLEELPAFAKEHDIMKMFSDYSLLSIIIVVTKDIRKQYMAYVQFVNAEDAKAALNNKSKHLIGHKVIKVSACSEAAFEIAKVNQNNGNDIVEKNEDVDDQEEYPRDELSSLPRDPRQRRFDNRQDEMEGFNKQGRMYHSSSNQNAVNPRSQWRPGNMTSMNSSGHTDREYVPMSRRPQMMKNDYNSSYTEPRLDCVFIKGLPLRTTDTDILEFFSDVSVIPTKVHLMLTIQGQPSGDCFCEFLLPEEAAQAVTKHGCKIDKNTVSVELVTKQVVNEARGIHVDKGFIPRGGFRGSRGYHPSRGFRRMRGTSGPYHTGNRGIPRFSGPNDPMYNSFDGPGMGFGMPGCVLSLENVPFRAEIDEILNFFRNFNVSQNDVIRRFNEKGHPTGDVRVSLRSPIEAEAAIQQLNMQYIRDRPITVTLL